MYTIVQSTNILYKTLDIFKRLNEIYINKYIKWILTPPVGKFVC